MSRITVTHRHGESFDVRVRGYALISDEPVTLGGDDEGPTPTELVVAGLAACTADETVRSLAASGAGFQPVEVEADFSWDPNGSRVKQVRLSIKMPADTPRDSVDAVMESALRCPARKMLTEPPTIEYQVPGFAIGLAGRRDGGSWRVQPLPGADSKS